MVLIKMDDSLRICVNSEGLHLFQFVRFAPLNLLEFFETRAILGLSSDFLILATPRVIPKMFCARKPINQVTCHEK